MYYMYVKLLKLVYMIIMYKSNVVEINTVHNLKLNKVYIEFTSIRLTQCKLN